MLGLSHPRLFVTLPGKKVFADSVDSAAPYMFSGQIASIPSKLRDASPFLHFMFHRSLVARTR